MQPHTKITRPIVKDWSCYVNNECMSGVTAPAMGNAQPPTSASTTWAQQTSNNIGSGDRWDNNVAKKSKRTKVKIQNTKPQNEGENVNPYDKIGNMLLSKLKIPNVFTQSKGGSVRQNTPKKYTISKIK